jgi:hypothetical protein
VARLLTAAAIIMRASDDEKVVEKKTGLITNGMIIHSTPTADSPL